MKLEEISEIYLMISGGVESISARKQAISLRKNAFTNTLNPNIVKLAFDTRRVDQESEYISRRGLQNYNRSEQFITEATLDRLKGLTKIKDVLESLKLQYGKDHKWQDSYCRVLLDTINKSLRVDQKDGDFTDAQPGVGSFDYIEEMLYVRYRLPLSNVISMSEDELKKIFLTKDSELVNKDMNNLVSIQKSDVGRESYDSLIEKLFGGVKATKDGKSVERSVTITIRDTILDD